ALAVVEVGQQRDVAPGDDAALADLELPGVEHGKGEFAFLDHRPARVAAGDAFAQVARIADGKFDHGLSSVPDAPAKRCSINRTAVATPSSRATRAPSVRARRAIASEAATCAIASARRRAVRPRRHSGRPPTPTRRSAPAHIACSGMCATTTEGTPARSAACE